LVIAGVGLIAEPGSDRFIQLAILTAFGVGVTQFLMGIFRMGFLVNFLSHPVLSGFTSAAAIIIGASQIGSLLGLNLPKTSFVPEIAYHVFHQISNADLLTASIGIGSVLLMIILRKWKRSFPAALVVVVLGILITYFLGLHQTGLKIVGTIPSGLPSFSTGWMQFGEIGALIPLILVISLVGYMESIAVAKAIASKQGYRVDPNQELVALGSANIGGSFFQIFPVTGGLSRTAVNNQAGAKSGVASLISAGVIGLTLLFLTPLFYYLPSAILASIIMVAVTSLFDHKEIKHLWKTDKRDLLMFGVTFFATLFLGIEEGIAVGVITTLITVIYQSSTPHSAELGRLEGTHTYRNILRYPEAEKFDDILIFRFDSQLYFANADYFRDTIEKHIAERNGSVKHLVIDASAITGIDSTGMHVLETMINELSVQGVQLYIASATGPIRDSIKQCGVLQSIGEQHFFFDVDHAIRFIRNDEIPEIDHKVNQTFF